MKNIKLIILLLIIIVIIGAGITLFSIGKYIAPKPLSLMTEAEARAIAEKTCIKGGEALKSGIYNENSKTWWFDANLNATREGCNPACVVSEETEQAEINWRCTGLIIPEESATESIKQMFVEKYPKYTKTLAIEIGQETETHIRGDVIFVPGQPRGYFFAAKINGEWQIMTEGNGEISCDLEKYGFPKEMLSDCAK